MLAPFPHIRFWQGFKSQELADDNFLRALQNVLIPMTTGTNAGRGLIGYQPVVLKVHPTVALPDEMALVIYRNASLYEAIRATPEGARYGTLHHKLDGVRDIPGMEHLEGREFFTRDNGRGGKSGSAEAIPVADLPHNSPDRQVFSTHDVHYGKAYAPKWGTEAIWQGGAVLARVHLPRSGWDTIPHPELNFMDSLAHYLKLSAGLDHAAHVVRLEREYILEFLIGRDKDEVLSTLQELDPHLTAELGLETFQTTWLESLDDAQNQARNFTLTRDGEGSGYVLKFATGPLSLPKDNAKAALALAPYLRELFLKIASPATAYDVDSYLQRMGISRLTGHCAAVAYVVQKILGGELVRGEVVVRINGEPREEVHYWNRIGDIEIDVTGSQYGGDGLHALDDPAGKPQPVSDGETSVDFVSLKTREIRQSVTYADRFGILETFMNKLLNT